MALENDHVIEAPGLAGINLPAEGNAAVDKTKALGSETNETNATLSDAEKLILAEQKIKEREETKKIDAEKARLKAAGKESNEEEEQEDELTEEQITATLAEIEKKDQTTLTDNEKAFLEKHTSEPLDEISSVKKDFETTYGIVLEGDYENSANGLKQLANDVAPKIGEQIFLNYLDSVPYMREFFDHVAIKHKGIETFLAKNEKPIFESIEIKPLGEVEEANKPKMVDNLKTLLKMDLANKGNSEDDVSQLIQLYEANGTLYDKAKLAKENLGKTHKAIIDAQIQAEEARLKQQEDAVQLEYNTVKDMLTKNDIGGVSIPAGDVKPFTDAMLRTLDAQGNTMMDVKRSKLTLAQRSLLDYIIFKDFKVTGLQGKAATQSKTFTFKKANDDNNARKGGRVRNGTSQGDGKTVVTQGNPNIDIKGFLIQRETIN